MLICKAQTTRHVLIEVTRAIELGSVSRSVERVAVVFDARYKHCSKEVCVNGGVELKAACADEAREDVALCLFASTATGLNLLGSGPDVGRSTPPPAAKKVKLSKLCQRRVACLHAAPLALGVLLKAMEEAVRTCSTKTFSEERRWQFTT